MQRPRLNKSTYHLGTYNRFGFLERSTLTKRVNHPENSLWGLLAETGKDGDVIIKKIDGLELLFFIWDSSANEWADGIDLKAETQKSRADISRRLSAYFSKKKR